MLLGVLFGIICMLAQALVPTAVGRAIDDGIIERDQSALVLWGGAVLGLAVVQAVTGILRDRAALASRLGAAYRTAQDVTRQACRLGATLSKRLATGDVVSVGASDIDNVGEAMAVTARGFGSVVAIVVVAVIMLSASWQIGLTVLLGVPLMTWLITLLLRPLHNRQQELRNRQGKLTGRAVDIVSGLRVLRGIGGEDSFAGRYREESQEVRRAGVEVARVEVLLDGAKVLLPGALVASVIWLGGHYTLAGRISAGQLVAFYGYTVFLVGPLNWLTDAADRITKGYVSAGRVTHVLRLEPLITDAARRAEVPDREDELTDPSSGLVVRSGILTAVACDVPAQATALADRLGRYADSEATLGGVPLREWPVHEIRRRILVARNEDRLFNGPLRDELDGRREGPADAPAIEAAVRTAGAGEIIDALPDGLDTAVAQGGREFSGGQQQRLRLVRALVADPPTLLLLEPTSAVDAHTEAGIAGRLRASREGRTTVVFTTSPILLNHADHVVFMEGGRVAAEGKHAELLTDARYRDLVMREDAL
ncbi:ABC transporter ATP-binding protein [Streptomyces sp. S.PNR 29]|uniref:ABC transporter ATP-binding protein n=1 Tax=Streptomyces sp. S.PNR 29 TaxID=2973805 RepID=UPI0025B19A48|nr:ABC transporter ATP-binding protein [Streptomyces sp. S.PNR 29]MDN0193988.1 ABC transporter ATP-binding protein/permease [Streptomyces sp. S.PNR 29]